MAWCPQASLNGPFQCTVSKTNLLTEHQWNEQWNNLHNAWVSLWCFLGWATWAEPRWCWVFPGIPNFYAKKNTYTSIIHICICYIQLYSPFQVKTPTPIRCARSPSHGPSKSPYLIAQESRKVTRFLPNPVWIPRDGCTARDCAMLGRLTLTHWCRASLYCSGVLASWAGPRDGCDTMHNCVKPGPSAVRTSCQL